MCCTPFRQRVSPAQSPSAWLDTKVESCPSYAITASSYHPTICKSSKTSSWRLRTHYLRCCATASPKQSMFAKSNLPRPWPQQGESRTVMNRKLRYAILSADLLWIGGVFVFAHLVGPGT